MNSTTTNLLIKPTWSISYVLTIAIAVFLTFLLHEFSHWLVGELLGEQMAMNLNSAYPINSVYQQEWHRLPITIAGPAFTLLQAVVVFWLMKNKPQLRLYPFLLTPLIMRILAGVMNLINPNDEGRISVALGLGLFTLPVLICAILLYLVICISSIYQLRTKFNTLNVILVVVFSSILILANQFATSK